jgi:hypothetical protein
MRRLLTVSAPSLALLLAACGTDSDSASTNDVTGAGGDGIAATADTGGNVPIDADATPSPGEDAATPAEDAAADDVPLSDSSAPSDTTPDDSGAVEDAGASEDAGAPPNDTTAASDTAEDLTDAGGPADVETPADTGATDTAGPGPDVVTPTCVTLAAGHARHVVVSKPYSATGGQAKVWETFPLEAEGTLGASVETFQMGRAYYGLVAFRADGALGAVAQDDGSLGVFSLDAAGHATVIHAELDPGAYAETVQFDEAGTTLYIVDPNWPNNGGGLYTAPVGCDGSVGPAEKLYETKLALDVMIDGGSHLVAARAAVTEDEGHLHRVTTTASGFEHTAGVNVFGDTEDILSAFAVTTDRKFALVGDNSSFSGIPNRIGVVSLTPGVTLAAAQVLTPVEDPMQFIVSPYGNAVLVVSGYDNAVRVLSYDPTAGKPFVDIGEPAYIGQSPQLPSAGLLIGESHPGVMLVVENVAVRRLRFEPSGMVTDLGVTAVNDSFVGIPGAIGVQP